MKSNVNANEDPFRGILDSRLKELLRRLGWSKLRWSRSRKHRRAVARLSRIRPLIDAALAYFQVMYTGEES